MRHAGPPARRVVLVGGGHAHVQVLRRLAMDPWPAADVTVVLDRPVAVYSGMVPALVAGEIDEAALSIDVRPLARRAGARVVVARALRVDAEARRVELEGRPPLTYDLASLNVGSAVAGLEVPGVREHAVPTRPIAGLVARVEALVARAREAPPDAPLDVVVVGGGAGGVELAFTLEHRLRVETGRRPRVVLVDAADAVPRGGSAALQRRVAAAAAERGITLLTGATAAAVEAGAVRLADGRALPADAVLWAAGAAPPPLIAVSDLPKDARGFVRVDRHLRVEGRGDLFAAGDCAVPSAAPRLPRAGVHAVRQGPVLATNLGATLRGWTLARYRPQRSFLALLNLGGGEATGGRWGLAARGRWVQALKARIDGRFVARFQVLAPDGAEAAAGRGLPAMAGADAMICGGCAAKVGQGALSAALARLGVRDDPSVVLGLAAPDDAAAVRVPSGDVVVATVDAFRAFTDDPWLVGRVAAVNAAGDVLAKGASPRWALATVALPDAVAGDEARAAALLHDVLAGVRAALDPLGATLVGGHSTTAGELLVGLTVLGLAPAGRPLWTLGGLRPGDALLLTRPLGTGVLFHADALGRAAGPWIEAAVARMTRPHADAVRALAGVEVRACTDVTGFGLAGHLGELLRRAGASARLALDAVPLLPGALALTRQGLRSTAWEENARALRALRVAPAAAAHPALPLLFDPQTAGGLLVGVPAAAAAEALARLHAAGEGDAARVGEVLPADPDGALCEIVPS